MSKEVSIPIQAVGSLQSGTMLTAGVRAQNYEYNIS